MPQETRPSHGPAASARTDAPAAPRRRTEIKHSPARKLAAAGIVAAGAVLVLTMFIVGLSDRNTAERDFISYWAAGRAVTSGANPYDITTVRQLEAGAGRSPAATVLMMRNPWIALPVVAPLGLLSPKDALIVWLVLLIAALGTSVWLLWRLNGRPDSIYHLLGIVFAPALACFMAGQFGIVLLLGIVLFLYFERSRPFAAGAALVLCAFKPHLFVAMAVPLVLWIAVGRRFRLAAGFVATLAAVTAVAYALDPQMISQYLAFLHEGEPLAERIPALSVALRFAISPHRAWIQFVPQGLACVWAGWYFWMRRGCWKWTEHGMLVLLVGAVCTPYGFFTDESMLLPAVLAGVYGAAERGRSLIPIAVIAGSALIELLAGGQINTPYFMWTTPAWLAWYLYATRGSREATSRSTTAPAC